MNRDLKEIEDEVVVTATSILEAPPYVKVGNDTLLLAEYSVLAARHIFNLEKKNDELRVNVTRLIAITLFFGIIMSIRIFLDSVQILSQ